MMREITEYDLEMSEKMHDWLEFGDDGLFHLKENAPDDVKKYYKKLQKIYEDF